MLNLLLSEGRDESPGREPGLVDFRRSLPPIVPSLQDAAAVALRDLAHSASLGDLLKGGRIRGEPADWAAGAAFLAPRLKVRDLDRIAPTNGTQAALLMLFAHLVRPGRVVLAEALTYSGLKPLAAAARVELRAVPIDEDGVVPDAFDAACRTGEPCALYCNPTVHNPTTHVMSVERRQALAAVARRHGVPIIEDDALGRLHPNVAPPIAAVAPDVTWYIMSASKALAHGLRLAYLVAPSAADREAAEAAASISFWSAAPLTLAVMRQWSRGFADEISASIRAESLGRERLAKARLGRFGLVSQSGSMHAWLPLADGWTSDSFVAAAEAAGVKLRPASVFAPVPAPSPCAVRISLSTPDDRDSVAVGVERLALLLEGGARGAPV